MAGLWTRCRTLFASLSRQRYAGTCDSNGTKDVTNTERQTMQTATSHPNRRPKDETNARITSANGKRQGGTSFLISAVRPRRCQLGKGTADLVIVMPMRKSQHVQPQPKESRDVYGRHERATACCTPWLSRPRLVCLCWCCGCLYVVMSVLVFVGVMEWCWTALNECRTSRAPPNSDEARPESLAPSQESVV